MHCLPPPEVIRTYLDRNLQPPLPAKRLRWGPDAVGPAERLWYLPEDVCLSGPPPERFGFTLQRRGPDSYAVRLLWNRTHFHWPDLPRVQLLGSALAPLLRALGTDLWALLDRPTRGEAVLPLTLVLKDSVPPGRAGLIIEAWTRTANRA